MLTTDLFLFAYLLELCVSLSLSLSFSQCVLYFNEFRLIYKSNFVQIHYFSIRTNESRVGNVLNKIFSV
jgi:hypothetical protein